MDYAQLDQGKIIDYIFNRGGLCSVEELFAFSGANSLRIYPLLIRMKLQNLVDFVKCDNFGSPEIIRLVN